MNTIHKYILKAEYTQEVETRAGAQILRVQMQNEEICMWCLVDTSADVMSMTIQIVGTGHPAPSNHSFQYIDTVQMNGAQLVWHIFKRVF